jgi:hypothetical protein
MDGEADVREAAASVNDFRALLLPKKHPTKSVTLKIYSTTKMADKGSPSLSSGFSPSDRKYYVTACDFFDLKI